MGSGNGGRFRRSFAGKEGRTLQNENQSENCVTFLKFTEVHFRVLKFERMGLRPSPVRVPRITPQQTQHNASDQ